MMSTQTVHCWLEDKTARVRTGYPPSYAEAKKMKSLRLHTCGCLRASLKDTSFFQYNIDFKAKCPFFNFICL